MFTREMEAIREQVKSLLDLVPVMGAIERQLDNEPRNLSLIADVAFLTTKSKDILESFEKRLNQLENKAAQYGHNIFPFWAEKNYSTDNCTVSDNSNFYVKFPSSPTQEGYVEFVKQLPPEAVRPHYPTVTELITKKLEEGEQIPYGLPAFGIISVLPKLRVTSKKEL